MRKELLAHATFWLVFFVVIIVIKQYFSLPYILFVLGGLLGIILPDIDHLIYAYFVKPTDLTSQRINYLVNKSEIRRTVELLYETRGERRELIFHSILFQVIFFVLMFWVLSSSGSLLGRGLVLSFMLHLSVDQFIDLKATGSLDSWFKNLPIRFDATQSKAYWMITTSITVFMGLVM